MLLEILTTVLAAILAICVFVRVRYPWVKDDIQDILLALKLEKLIKKQITSREFPVDILERHARDRPNNTFIIFQGRHYSYEFMDKKANQIARAAMELGLKSGDIAAIMMLNEPAFLWTYFGLLKVGVSVCLLNHHLRLQSLLHCILTCQPKVIFVGKEDELCSALKDIEGDLCNIRVLTHDDAVSGSRFECLRKWTDDVSSDPVDRKYRAEVTFKDAACYIFTSGTTGLPKAAVMTHAKTVFGQVGLSSFDFNEHDVLYETLPLYHTAALNIGVLGVMLAGSSMVLGAKFSASNFWKDCRAHRVTVIHYIGEMCRYLVNKPESPEDGIHDIRVAVGNGLRKDIWGTFQSRFKIPRIVEFYAATESPVGIINIFNRVGSVGRSSPLTRMVTPVEFVEFDSSTRLPRRDANGKFVPAGKDNIGLLIVPLNKVRTFEGYYNKPDDTENKRLHDVFKPGDVYFNTGDLFYIDNSYNLFFQDRTGDTYRWKGENVSTNEVANVLCSVEGVHDANVYGVTVSGCEGRAGMAAIHLKDGATLGREELHTIKQRCSEQLPAYARPKFLRVQRQMSLTSTFKQKKVDLMNEAFDPKKVHEPLYFYDNETNNYQAISEDIYEKIVAGKVSIR